MTVSAIRPPTAAADTTSAVDPGALRRVAGPSLAATRANILAADAAARALYARLHDLKEHSVAAQRQVAGFRSRVAVVQRMTDQKQLNHLHAALQRQITQLRAKVKASVPKQRPVSPMEERFNRLGDGRFGDLNRNGVHFDRDDINEVFPPGAFPLTTPTKKPKAATRPTKLAGPLRKLNQHEVDAAIDTLSSGRGRASTEAIHTALNTLRIYRVAELTARYANNRVARDRRVAMNALLFETMGAAMDALPNRYANAGWDREFWQRFARGQVFMLSPGNLHSAAEVVVRETPLAPNNPLFGLNVGPGMAERIYHRGPAALADLRRGVDRILRMNARLYIPDPPRLRILDDVLARTNLPSIGTFLYARDAIVRVLELERASPGATNHAEDVSNSGFTPVVFLNQLRQRFAPNLTTNSQLVSEMGALSSRTDWARALSEPRGVAPYEFETWARMLWVFAAWVRFGPDAPEVLRAEAGPRQYKPSKDDEAMMAALSGPRAKGPRPAKKSEPITVPGNTKKSGGAHGSHSKAMAFLKSLGFSAGVAVTLPLLLL